MKTLRISSSFVASLIPRNFDSSTRQSIQEASEGPFLIGVNNFPSRLVSSRSIITNQPGSLIVSILIPKSCSHSPSQFEANHFCRSGQGFISDLPRSQLTRAFSCGARSASELKGKGYLRTMLSRRQLQGLVR